MGVCGGSPLCTSLLGSAFSEISCGGSVCTMKISKCYKSGVLSLENGLLNVYQHITETNHATFQGKNLGTIKQSWEKFKSIQTLPPATLPHYLLLTTVLQDTLRKETHLPKS